MKISTVFVLSDIVTQKTWAHVVARSRMRASEDARKPLEKLIEERASDGVVMLLKAMQQPSLHHMICEEIATRN